MKKFLPLIIGIIFLLILTSCDLPSANKLRDQAAAEDFIDLPSSPAQQSPTDDGWYHNLVVDCALDDHIIFTFQFNPQITWDLFLDHEGTTITCKYQNSHTMKCIAPNEQVNGKYVFHFEGHEDSTLYTLDPELDPPTSCVHSQDGMTIVAYPWCQTESLVITMVYSPEDAVLSTPTLDGNTLSCSNASGHGLCILGPGNPSATFDFSVQLNDTVFTFPMILPDCPVAQQKQPSNQPADCGCEIVDVECVNQNTISFLAQTCVEDPKPLQAGSITALDGVSSYTCEEVPIVDGRVYCVGPHPVTPGQLTIVYYFAEGGVTNQCFLPEWPDQIIGCQNAAPPVTVCSIYTDEKSCESNGCTWYPPTFGALGYCK